MVGEAVQAERESCEGCGFVWDETDLDEIRTRLVEATARLASIFASTGGGLGQRPADGVWSPIEYGSHVRDVLLNLRDRIVVALGEVNPSPKPMYGTLRVDHGMYRSTVPGELAVDLAVATRLFDQLLLAVTEDESERPIFYGWPRPATRTVRWVAAQALHEVEHDLGDVERATDPAG